MLVRNILIVLVLSAFAAILVLNFYFRARVLRAYRHLVQNRIQFQATDVFSAAKIDAIVAQHPEHEVHIRKFMNNIRRSVQLASVLIMLITAFAAILMFSR